MTTTKPRIPFPGAVWNQPVSEIGFASDQSLADRFYRYAGGPAPKGALTLSLTHYSVPIYDAAVQKPTTTIRLYQSVWARNTGNGYFIGVAPGDSIPWNFAWVPGTANDRIMIVENIPLKGPDGKITLATLETWAVYDAIYNGWDWLGPNNLHGFSQTYPYDAFTDPRNAGNGKVVTAAAVVTRGTWDPGWRTVVNRGMGINKRALITTADEVASGDIGHALELTINNTAWTSAYPGKPFVDFLPPATRCEWPVAVAPTRNGTDHFDGDPAHNLPEGLRLALDMTEADMDAFVARKGYTGVLATTVKTFLRAFVKYGAIVAETGDWGTNIETTGVLGPDAPKWKALGIDASRIDVLEGALSGSNLKVVKATVQPST